MMMLRSREGRADISETCQGSGCDACARLDAVLYAAGSAERAVPSPSCLRRVRMGHSPRAERAHWEPGFDSHRSVSRRPHSVDGAECGRQQAEVSGTPWRDRERRGRLRRRRSRGMNLLSRIWGLPDLYLENGITHEFIDPRSNSMNMTQKLRGAIRTQTHVHIGC